MRQRRITNLFGWRLLLIALLVLGASFGFNKVRVVKAAADYINPSYFIKAGSLANTGIANKAIVGSATNPITNVTTGANGANTAGGSTGAVWSKKKIDLAQDQSFSFEMNFGTSTTGNEGMAFVLQNDPNGANAIAKGTSNQLDGQSIGVWGVDSAEFTSTASSQLSALAKTAIQNSWALECDTLAESGVDRNGMDSPMTSEHIGNEYPSESTMMKPYQIVGYLNAGTYYVKMIHNQPITGLSLTNGNWHTVQLSWLTSTKTMTMTLDGTTTQNYAIDTTKLGGTSVYWGFTSATNKNMPSNQSNQLRLLDVPGAADLLNRKLTMTSLPSQLTIAQNTSWSPTSKFSYDRTDGNGTGTTNITNFDATDGLTYHQIWDDESETTTTLINTTDYSANLTAANLSKLGNHKLTYWVSDAYGHESSRETVNVTVLSGKLTLKVADTIDFLTTVLTGKTQQILRTGDLSVSVDDGRINADQNWHLTVQQEGDLVTSDGQKLAGYLTYVASDGTVFDLRNSAASIATEAANQNWSENWVSNQGILLQLSSSATPGNYSGQLEWTLSDAP